jgi:hypothetical protein
LRKCKNKLVNKYSNCKVHEIIVESIENISMWTHEELISLLESISVSIKYVSKAFGKVSILTRINNCYWNHLRKDSILTSACLCASWELIIACEIP